MCKFLESSPWTTDVNYTSYKFIFYFGIWSPISGSLDMGPYLQSPEHLAICLPKANYALWSP